MRRGLINWRPPAKILILFGYRVFWSQSTCSFRLTAIPLAFQPVFLCDVPTATVITTESATPELLRMARRFDDEDSAINADVGSRPMNGLRGYCKFENATRRIKTLVA